ncbi:MAG TPA: hypothetical protein VGB77_10670 [Abditibacteriaceae bacterium]|jgi:hypothetical protein
MTDQELARALFEAGILTQEQVQAAAAQRTPTRNLAQVVVDNGWASREQIIQIAPQALGSSSEVTSFGPPPVYTPSVAPLPSPTGYNASTPELSGRTRLTIKKLDVLSVALTQAAIGAVFGIFIGAFYGLFLGSMMAMMTSGMSGAGGSPSAGGGVAGFLIGIIVFPIMYGILGFIGGALAAFVYNLVSNAFGGIKMDVEAIR